MRSWIMVVALMLWAGIGVASEVDDILLNALESKESKGNASKVGDKHMVYRAHGVLQIRKPYLDDVNRIVGKKAMREKWGKSVLTMQDMKDRGKARWSAVKYLTYYGKVYQDRTGREPTDEIYSRIHNGGPFGWKTSATDNYWASVQSNIKVIRYQIVSVDRAARFLKDWKLELEIGVD